MKQILIALASLFVCVLTGCNEKQKNKKDPKTDETTNNSRSSIEGNWETVSFEVNGKPAESKRFPRQFKMFHDGYFSLLAYDDSGEFAFAAAGTYEISDSLYKETCTYHSVIADIGFTDSQKWEIKGDTLIFYGFEKATMGDGKDITQEINANGKFIEKRVRAKR